MPTIFLRPHGCSDNSLACVRDRHFGNQLETVSVRQTKYPRRLASSRRSAGHFCSQTAVYASSASASRCESVQHSPSFLLAATTANSSKCSTETSRSARAVTALKGSGGG